MTLRVAFLWFNRFTSYVGLAFMLAEITAWTWASVQAGHVIRFTRFHQQFEQRLFEVFDRHEAGKDERTGNREE